MAIINITIVSRHIANVIRAKKISKDDTLTHVCHVVHAVAGPLAPDDPDRHAGDAEEHRDGHTEAYHQTQVSDHHTDTVSCQVRVRARPTHASST